MSLVGALASGLRLLTLASVFLAAMWLLFAAAIGVFCP